MMCEPVAGVQFDRGPKAFDRLVKQVRPIDGKHRGGIDACRERIKLLSNSHCTSRLFQPAREAQRHAEPLVCGRIAGVQIEPLAKILFSGGEVPAKKLKANSARW